MISNQDISLAVIKMADATTVPTSGAMLGLNFEAGSFTAVKASQQIESNTSKPNRSRGNARRGVTNVSGSFNVRIQKSEAFELLMASLQSNDYDDGKVVNGSKKHYFMLEATLVDDDADGSIRNRYLGCQVTSISFNIANGEGIVATVNWMGLDADEGLTTPSTLTLTPAPDTLEFIGSDVENIAVEGVTIDGYTALQVNIEQPREAKHVIGSHVAKANAASAPRNISGSLSYFKTVLTDPAQFTGEPQALTFDLGTVYRFTFPSITCQNPAGDFSASQVEDRVDWNGGWKNTAGCDFEFEIL